MPAGFSIQAMHTYAIEWTPTKVTWTVDGTEIHTNTTNKVPTVSAKIMMNLWVFGSAGAFGNPANNKYPFHSSYEYFRFYKWNQETTYPYADPKTQLPAADTMFSQNNPSEKSYP
jgi:beta-glucanase (GH16 family)